MRSEKNNIVRGVLCNNFKTSRGFGFMWSTKHKQEVFLHIDQCVEMYGYVHHETDEWVDYLSSRSSDRIPQLGQEIMAEVIRDRQGRLKAVRWAVC